MIRFYSTVILKSNQSKTKVIDHLRNILHLKSPEDWELLSSNQIKQHGGASLLNSHSLYEIKCIGCPEGKEYYSKPNKTTGYWNNKENIENFLIKLKQNLFLNTINDWNSITVNQIKENGGNGLLQKYSLYEIKCLGFPDGKLEFKKKRKENKPFGYWNKEENIKNFLNELKVKFNLKTEEDWKLLSSNHIKSNGGGKLLNLYSMNELRSIGYPKSKFLFLNPENSSKYWEKDENIQLFVLKLKEKLNLKTSNDWNLINYKQIQDLGGDKLLKKYSLYDIKVFGCPEGKFDFSKPKKSKKYWEIQSNVNEFLSHLKYKYNLVSFNDWNRLTSVQINENGGNGLLRKYSLYDIKCLGFPDGKLEFLKSKTPKGFWDKKENILHFLNQLKDKFNLNTPEDWNSISIKQIESLRGEKLLKNYSLYDLKCLGCPEGISLFNKPVKSAGYWDKNENIHNFLDILKVKLNLNSPEDWNKLSSKQIKAFGGGSLLHSFSIFDLKCLGCPEGKSLFSLPYKPPGYWDNDENIKKFLDQIKQNLSLYSIDDCKRVSKSQIIFHGGIGLFSKYSLSDIIKLLVSSYNTDEFRKNDFHKCGGMIGRSSQRWLFLQIQKLFPGEEIVEDYFHSELSRKTGYSVQFDVFLVDKNIAFEYHGQQHYEDNPYNFAPLEMYKKRDFEKEKLCSEFGIQLIIVPYWWDNMLDSLKVTVEQKLKL